MTDLQLLLPRANAPIAGAFPATREFYDFLRELISLSDDQSSDAEAILALAKRVLALESDSQNSAVILGVEPVVVTGSLAAGEVIIQLESTSLTTCSAVASFSGGLSAIAVGTFCDLSIPFGFGITQATLVGDPSGALEIDILNVDLSMYPPLPANTEWNLSLIHI